MKLCGVRKVPITVKEVTMVSPDTVCVEARDGAITHGQIFSNGGVSIAASSSAAVTITNVSSSPIDGSIRITCTGSNVFAPFYFNINDGSAGTVGITGVAGVPNCNGSWDILRINNDTADLCATRFTGTWTPGTGKVWDYSRWTTFAPAGRRGWLAGTNQEYFRSCDLEPDAFLDRTAATNPANWASFGGRTVIAVYIKSKNYDHGYADLPFMGQFGQTSSLKHHLYLKLDGPLAQGGPYAIVNSAASISTNLTWNDRSTRALAINVNQIGYRPDDVGKIAYLSHWMPGAPNEGAVDYSAFTQFEIINNVGTTVGGPFPIVLRIASGQAEERVSIPVDNITSGYSSADGKSAFDSTNPAKRQNITAMTAANPAVFTTATNHGWAVGKRLRLKDMGGDDGPFQLTHASIRVDTVPAPNQFTAIDFGTGVPVRGDNLPPYAPWHSRSGKGYVVELQENNRAGTNVYGLEFPTFTTSTAGNYRLRIAGLGVSDPFPVRSTVWNDLAKIMAGGEYHHRWGIALDGRFGYTRPQNFTDGVTAGGNQGKIYQSKVPYPMGWGAPLFGINGQINDAIAARPEWFFPTGTPYTWYQSGYGAGGGSWADAGDWCTRLASVTGAVYSWCELVLMRPQKAASTAYGLPKLLEMFPTVPEYAGTNSLPEMFTQAVFGLEGYRRMQHGPGSFLPEGSVPGGMMMDTGTGTSFTPSNLSPSVNYANAPDQMSNFYYAHGAGKIAQVFYAYGFNAAGDMWKNSAIKAWNWAELLFGSFTEQDNYYNGVLGLEARMASTNPPWSGTPWTHTTYVNNLATLNNEGNSGIARTNAAAVLYRLTGLAVYKTVIETDLGYGGGNPNNIWFDCFGGRPLAAWEYHQTPGINAAAKSVIADTFKGCYGRIEAGLEIFTTPKPISACRTMMVADNNQFNIGSEGIDISGYHWAFIASHAVSGDSRYLQVLQDGMAFICGANMSGMTSIAQVGTRWPGTIFNMDNLMFGSECASGIGCYMFHFIGQWLFSFGTWSPASNAGCVEGPDPNYAADHNAQREVIPGRYAAPVYEAVWESHFQLNLMERSVQQDVFPLQNVAFYLDAWDETAKTITNVTLISNNNPSDTGEIVLFTATVTGTGGPPTGTVTFRDGGSPIGSGTLAAGVATFSTTALSDGTHSITAFYSGDVTFAQSGSAALAQVVVGTAPPPGPNPYQFSSFAM